MDNSGNTPDEFDLGKMLFGDHKCFHCEKPIKSGEKHIEVPADDYMREEMGVTSGFASMGMDATIFFCSDCTVEAETGYVPEAHEIDNVEVPDTLPEGWS